MRDDELKKIEDDVMIDRVPLGVPTPPPPGIEEDDEDMFYEVKG